MTEEEPPSVLPPQLAIAEDWARRLGNRVTRSWGTYPDGRKEPAVFIGHAAYTIICTEKEQALNLLAIVEIQSEAREKLKRLTKNDQERILATLKLALMQEGRSGFSFFPSEFQQLWEIQAYQIVQILRIAENQPGSFNRFADAIQELSTGILRSSMVLASLPLRQVSGGNMPMQVDSKDNSMYR